MKISLLHATRGTPDRALATAQLWRQRAALPDSIEHLFAIQGDDRTSVERFSAAAVDFVTTVPPPAWASSSVANWNAAAARSTGDLLVVIADDLLPPDGWDQSLRQLPPDAQQPYACYVPDTVRQDGLMCHPVLSRGLYQKRGYVFHPSFFGVYCDNDFTTRTQLEAPIFRVPNLLWQHEHFSKKKTAPDQNARIQNSDQAYHYGKAVFDKLWPFQAAFDQSLKAGGPLSSYLLTLATLARGCDHVTEFGVHGGESTLAFLHGISNKEAQLRSYHPSPVPEIGSLLERRPDIPLKFSIAEPTDISPIDSTDLLFLNTRPIHSQILRELSTHACRVQRFLVIPQTEQFSKAGADSGPGISRALLEWITTHPEWKIELRSSQNGGLTIMKRSHLAT